MSRCPVCDHEVHVDGCVGTAYQAIVAKVAREQAIKECVYVAEAIASRWREWAMAVPIGDMMGLVREGRIIAAAAAMEVALNIRKMENK